MSKAWRDRSTGRAHWRRIRLLVLERDLYACQINGPKCTKTATQVDHILGVDRSERIEDLRAACQPCNAAYRPPSNPTPTPRSNW